MGKPKKNNESEYKKSLIIKMKHKTSEECIACLKSSQGCDRGRLYLDRWTVGKTQNGVPCFK